HGVRYSCLHVRPDDPRAGRDGERVGTEGEVVDRGRDVGGADRLIAEHARQANGRERDDASGEEPPTADGRSCSSPTVRPVWSPRRGGAATGETWAAPLGMPLRPQTLYIRQVRAPAAMRGAGARWRRGVMEGAMRPPRVSR